MNNFDCIVSLGYNCYPCMYAEKKMGKLKKNIFLMILQHQHGLSRNY